MEQALKKHLFFWLVCLVCAYGLFPLSARERQEKICLNQAFPNLDACIPPELQNLPYAIYPTSPDYNTARLNYNKRFVYFPKAIFAPTTPQEAQYVLSILTQYHLSFAVRSGGHCFEPGSLSSDYIIDLQNFNAIIPNVDKQEVYIGAGCVLGTVIDTLGQLDYAIPTGTCPTVGVTGLTLGGGIGLLARTFGLTCDSVKSITLLTADAEIIEVNASSYPDLFWALLGGGNGSYGIALGFTFQMYYIPQVTFYELIWEWDPQLISPIMHAWQSWVKNLPDNLSSVLGIRHPNHMCAQPSETPPLVIRVFGLKVGAEPFTEWECAFKELRPWVRTFSGRFVDISKYWALEPALPFNKAKSRILRKPVTENVMKEVTRFFTRLERRNPNYLVYFNFEAFGGVIPQFHTSFFPRHAFGWWFQAYYWGQQKQSPEVLALSRRFYAKIPREVSKDCYANIVDYDLGKDYLKLYYGNHVKRLIKIKDKYDPLNIFHWRQSIPTSQRLFLPYKERRDRGLRHLAIQ